MRKGGTYEYLRILIAHFLILSQTLCAIGEQEENIQRGRKCWGKTEKRYKSKDGWRCCLDNCRNYSQTWIEHTTFH